MSASTIILITLLMLMGGLAWCAFWMASFNAYRKQVAELYRKSYEEELKVLSRTDELSQRVNEYVRQKNGRAPTKTEIIQSGKRIVPVIITDGRDLFLDRLGLYDEQCNNFIHLIKADLQLNGMS